MPKRSNKGKDTQESRNNFNNTGKVEDSIVIVGGDVNNSQLIINTAPHQRACPKPPPAPYRFGGRSHDLTALKQGLISGQFCGVTAVYGLGGIGKTTLVRQAAHDLYYTDKVFQAVLWSNITRSPDSLTLLLDWAYYGDFSFASGKLSLAQLPAHIKGLLENLIASECPAVTNPRTLVVLDDVWENGLEAARLLRQACPANSTVLLTTRSKSVALNFGAELHPIDRFNEANGVAMLQTHLPTADITQLKDLVNIFAGHALALELSARRVKRSQLMGQSDPLKAHLTQYRQGLPAGIEFTTLKLAPREDQEDNLARAFSFSYQELFKDDQARFRALGSLVYDKPFDIPLLSAIWQVEENITLETLETFISLSLLEPASSIGLEYPEGWYTLHPLVQSYARCLMLASADNQDASLFYLYTEHLKNLASKFTELPPEEWTILTPYLPHLHFIGDTLADRFNKTPDLPEEFAQLALDFATTITNYLYFRPENHRPEWLQFGLLITRRFSYLNKQALFLNQLGIYYSLRGLHQKSLDYYQEALTLYNVTDHIEGQALMLNNIGRIYENKGEKVEALKFYQQALPLAEKFKNLQLQGSLLNNIGLIYQAFNKNLEALKNYKDALYLFHRVKNLGDQAKTLTNIGTVYSLNNDDLKALEYLDRALPLRQKVGDKQGEANTLFQKGNVLLKTGDTVEARHLLERALRLSQAVADPYAEANILLSIGKAARQTGHKNDAISLIKNSLEIFQSINSPDVSLAENFLTELQDMSE